MRHSVDVILLTYKPTKQVIRLIDSLENQTYPVNKIIIMNTEKKYFDTLFNGTDILKTYNNIEVHHLTASEFDHAKTRSQGVKYSEADYFICMTHDAIPENEELIDNLVSSFVLENGVACAYAKQLPNPKCREIERYTRKFNYPDESVIKSRYDIGHLGIKTFFCSNVCAIYDRKIFELLGGFVDRAIFNEDMMYAGKAIKAGYRVVYAANASVIHSHNFTCKQQFKRNFDLGVSQKMHPEIFGGISSESEGKKLVGQTMKHLIDVRKAFLIPYLIVSSGAKFLGYKLGMHYNKLPYGIILKCTSNKNFWKK